MDLAIPDICFLTSSTRLAFDADGCTIFLEPLSSSPSDADHILVMPRFRAQQYRMTDVPSVSLFDAIPVPDGWAVPEIYDGTQDLHAKRVLILMLNDWGDMIPLEPVIRALYNMTASTGRPPRITLGCNGIGDFPYRDTGYVEDVIPDMMTLSRFCSFDIVVNLLPVNHQRATTRSMRDPCLDIPHLGSESGGSDTPSIHPDPGRVSRIRPIFDRIRRTTGKELLCVNWRSRFPHTSAPVSLFSRVAGALRHTHQALLLKDETADEIMQGEINALRAPIMNLSRLIRDHHDTIAALSLVDAFVSVDTGIVLAAGALGIPGVALFGPSPPETRVVDYPSVIPLEADFREAHRGCAEIVSVPHLLSPCSEAIDPGNVLSALEVAIGLRAGDSFTNRCFSRGASGRDVYETGL